MPLYRLESYQGDEVISSRLVELPDDEAAGRALLEDEEGFAGKLSEMDADRLISTFAGGSIGFRVGRESSRPEDASPRRSSGS